MNPIKVIGGVLVFLGLIFRGICTAYFRTHEASVPDTPKARRRFEARKRRAFLIDAAFIVIGFAIILER